MNTFLLNFSNKFKSQLKKDYLNKLSHAESHLQYLIKHKNKAIELEKEGYDFTNAGFSNSKEYDQDIQFTKVEILEIREFLSYFEDVN